MQRIPPLPPGITDAVVLVQDDERQPPLFEVVADSQACLASTDDDGSELLFAHCGASMERVRRLPVRDYLIHCPDVSNRLADLAKTGEIRVDLLSAFSLQSRPLRRRPARCS